MRQIAGRVFPDSRKIIESSRTRVKNEVEHIGRILRLLLPLLRPIVVFSRTENLSESIKKIDVSTSENILIF